MAFLRGRERQGLVPEDLALAVFGPWHEQADCDATPTPLWHRRVREGHLRALWEHHRAAIETAATEAGVAEPWIIGRLAFCDLLDGRQPSWQS